MVADRQPKQWTLVFTHTESGYRGIVAENDLLRAGGHTLDEARHGLLVELNDEYRAEALRRPFEEIVEEGGAPIPPWPDRMVPLFAGFLVIEGGLPAQLEGELDDEGESYEWYLEKAIKLTGYQLRMRERGWSFIPCDCEKQLYRHGWQRIALDIVGLLPGGPFPPPTHPYY
jgi:hypothetical protein